MLGAVIAAFFTVAGCAGLEPYTIDAPEELAGEIAEYKAEKEAENMVPDDAVEIELSPAIVGAEDNSSAWWTDFSQYFTIPVAKKLVINFVNYGGASNWNNWVLAITTAKARGAEGYVEYSVIRADNYGWGGEYDAANTAIDMDGTTPENDAWWDTFRDKMNGASVELSVDHASEGTAYVVATATATDGTIITETFHCPVSFVDDINVFMVADGAHAKLERAYITTSEYPILPDSNPAKVVITGNPTSIDYNADPEAIDFWGQSVATVVFEDESSMTVAPEDLIITAPDLTLPGNKTVVVTYSYTKKGVLTRPVSGYYNFELVAGLAGLQIVKNPSHYTYLYYDNAKLDFRPYGLMLQAVYDGGTTVPLTLDDVTISDIVMQEGEQDLTITYKPGSQAVTTTTKVNLVKGASAIGVPEYNSAWWTYFAPDRKVPSGESVSYEMDVYSVAAENWQSPVAILRKGDLALGGAGEYAVVRIDNYGWGSNFVNADENKESDWNWDLFKPMLNNAHVKITATNNGDNAVIRYDVSWANGEEHYQLYKNIAINDPDDVYLSFTVDNCYAVLASDDYVEPDVPDTPVTAVIESIAVTKQPSVNTYYFYDNTSLDFRTGGMEVTATYTDASTKPVSLSALNFSAITVAEGAQDVTVSLKENSAVSTTVSINLVKGAYAVGAADLTSDFWSGFTAADKVIPSGESRSFEMDVYSCCAENWSGPVAVLRKADLSLGADGEYGVVRVDNYGWGGGFVNDDANKESDWNWDLFKSMLTNAHMTITATNHGDGTASVRFDAVWANGEKHYQLYKNIAIDSADVQFGVTIDGCYLVVVE